MQIIYDDRKVQVWEFVSQGLNIGKWSTGKHCDGVAVVKKRENHYVSRRWHPSFNSTIFSRGCFVTLVRGLLDFFFVKINFYTSSYTATFADLVGTMSVRI